MWALKSLSRLQIFDNELHPQTPRTKSGKLNRVYLLYMKMSFTGSTVHLFC